MSRAHHLPVQRADVARVPWARANPAATPRLQRRSRVLDAAQSWAPPIVHEVLATSGRPLDRATRGDFEQRFHHDFSRVRLHDDSRAADSAAAVSALAYTVGHHVVSGIGNLASGDTARRQVLAHELTHVAQQVSVSRDPSEPLRIGPTHDAYESEAARVAESAAGGMLQHALRVSAPVMQRLGAADKGLPPCLRDAYRADERKVDLQPVFFKASDADASPTGTTWATRFAKSNAIWNRLGVTFTELSPVTLVDATRKTSGTTDAEILAILGTRSGAGVEVFLVDHELPTAGGGGTTGRGTAGAKVAIADRGSSDTLLAHELGHVLGLVHSPAADTNTIMEVSNSPNTANPTRVTLGIYNRMTWPASNGLVCITPDA